MRQKNLLLQQCLSPSQCEVILNQVIDQRQRFGLAKERDYELVDHTFTQWRKSNRLNTQKSPKKLGKDLKGALDGETLEHLVNERQIRDQLTSETLNARTAKKSLSKKPPYVTQSPRFTLTHLQLLQHPLLTGQTHHLIVIVRFNQLLLYKLHSYTSSLVPGSQR